MNEPGADADSRNDRERRERFIVFGPGPFEIFYLALIGTAVLCSLLLPLIHWIRGWLG